MCGCGNNFCGEPLNAVGDGLFGVCLTQQCKDQRAMDAQIEAQAQATLSAPAPVISKTVIWIIVVAVLIFIVGIYLLIRKKN